MKTASRKKSILLISLMLATGSAWAEWEEIASTEGGTQYVDPTTIRIDGDLRKAWTLLNMNKRYKEVRSMRSREEFNCKSELSRTLYISAHSELMAGGEVIFLTNYSDHPVKWREIPPNTINSATLKFVCGQ